MKSDISILLFYTIKMKIRETKSIIKNFFVFFILLLSGLVYFVYQLYKMLSANLELINYYSYQITMVISILILLYTLLNKQFPIKFHPANMLYLSVSKFNTLLKFLILKKVFEKLFIGIIISLLLNKFKIDFNFLKIALIIFNLLAVSFIVRYSIYNKNINVKNIILLLSYTLLANISLYISVSFSIILLLMLTLSSLVYIRNLSSFGFNFEKTFNEMVLMNKVKNLAIQNSASDIQDFNREWSAKKSRKINSVVAKISIKNPLIKKNLITFSRVKLSVTIYILIVFFTIFTLYKFEPFEFIVILKKSDIGFLVLVFHQAMLINNIINLIMDQKNILILKSKKGLYIPYKNMEVVKSFMVIGVPIIFIVTTFAGAFFHKNIWSIIISSILYSIILFVTLVFDKKKKLNIYGKLISVLILGVSYLLLN